jgi:hypothetical protein
MSTRGIMGLRIHGVDKLMYNHSDSYPEWLGNHVNNQLVQILKDPDRGIAWLCEKAEELIMVTDEEPPTQEEIDSLKKYSDLGVSNQSYNDWYCLLRHTHGELVDTLKAGYGVESKSFISDSLFCEWAYIVNLDTNCLEVYKGFQKVPHNKGRFAEDCVVESHRSNQYYPCALVREIPFGDLVETANGGNCPWVEELLLETWDE